jgi:predicted nucleotide-binding protein
MNAAIIEQLSQIFNDLKTIADSKPKLISNLLTTIETFEKAWSGSWIGHHSRIYYQNFSLPPNGAKFSIEWGLMDNFLNTTKGNWEEYNYDFVVNQIYENTKINDTNNLEDNSNEVKDSFDLNKSKILSLINNNYPINSDPYLKKLIEELESIKIRSKQNFIHTITPRQIMSRDLAAMHSGIQAPPHKMIWAAVKAFEHSYESCSSMSKTIQKLIVHISSIKMPFELNTNKKNIFIGHGRSKSWLELKGFLETRLYLTCEEFNRVPVSGKSVIERIKEMLDSSSFAFIVMTAEDEQPDGTMQARMNVIHESGLFQGRLGFERAIILLENGCTEFSNIHGLVQIRFPKNNIAACFEDVRQVLEREAILESASSKATTSMAE